MKLKYISAENIEKFTVDNINAEELSIQELKEIYTKCIDLLREETIKSNIYGFLVDLLRNIGDMEFLYRCGECGDSVYKYTIKTKNHTFTYTEGCVCYHFTLDDTILSSDTLDADKIKDALLEVSDLFENIEERNIINILIDFTTSFGEFIEKNANDPYYEEFIITIN